MFSPIRCVVAGSRNFQDYKLLTEKLNFYFQRYSTNQIVILSGTASGADKLGEQYAEERGIAVERYPADWDTHGKRAGYLRNQQMAKAATHCILFWDGESKGTGHMRDLAVKHNLTLRVVLLNGRPETRSRKPCCTP